MTAGDQTHVKAAVKFHRCLVLTERWNRERKDGNTAIPDGYLNQGYGLKMEDVFNRPADTVCLWWLRRIIGGKW